MSKSATLEMTEKASREAELELICKRNGGVLRAADIVEFAKNPETTLHSEFNWNIKEAANEHWLSTARRIVRAVVHIVGEDGDGILVRTYVNLLPDRGEISYRMLEDVLSDEEMTNQMLSDALRELTSFRRKYATLKELAKVHAAIDEVVK